MSVSRDDIARAATTVGITDRPVEVHASLSSFGHVAGGADAVVDGLLDAGCNVVVPSFSTVHYQVPADHVPAELRPRRNAEEQGIGEVQSHDVFDPESSVVNASEGAIVGAVTRRAGRARGTHPLNSFAAVGPLASELVKNQTVDDVYAPLRDAARLDGVVVLMGTGLDKMTLLHAAEELAGRAPFVRWAMGPDRKPFAARVGSCSSGFESLAPHLASVERNVTVGDSMWRVFPAADTLEIAARVIRDDPEITRCDQGPSGPLSGREQEGCPRCDDAIAGGPILD